MRRRKPNSCSKKTFATEAIAQEWLAIYRSEHDRGLRRKRKGKRGPRYVYRCVRCGAWHLTSQTPGKPRGRRKAGPKRSLPRNVSARTQK